jgi:tRNA A37 methylthiotransferase MiaB
VKKRNEMMVWREEDILVSKVEEGLIRGRTRNFKEVFVHTSKDIKIWELVKVRILKLDNWILIWELV